MEHVLGCAERGHPGGDRARLLLVCRGAATASTSVAWPTSTTLAANRASRDRSTAEIAVTGSWQERPPRSSYAPTAARAPQPAPPARTARLSAAAARDAGPLSWATRRSSRRWTFPSVSRITFASGHAKSGRIIGPTSQRSSHFCMSGAGSPVERMMASIARRSRVSSPARICRRLSCAPRSPPAPRPWRGSTSTARSPPSARGGRDRPPGRAVGSSALRLRATSR